MIRKVCFGMMVALAVFVVSGCCCGSKVPGVKTIGTDELKTIVEKKTALIFDARSVKYDTGERIPGARVMTTETAPDDVAKLIPGKNAAVVVYCSNTKCPAGGNLAAYLKKLGYTNLSEYPEGIEGWKAAGNKIEKAD